MVMVKRVLGIFIILALVAGASLVLLPAQADEPPEAEKIEELQDWVDSQGYNYTVAENWVTQLSPEEREALCGYRGAEAPEEPLPENMGFSSDVPVTETERVGQPPSYDAMALGYVTPVKDQSTCGSCWIFAATADFESDVAIGEASLLDFAEQEVGDCNIYYSVGGYDWCLGGNANMTTNFFTKYGSADETCHTYAAVPGTCQGCTLLKNADNWRMITGPNGETQIAAIKNAIQSYGPVYSTIYSSGPGFSAYNSGVYEYWGTETQNHAIEIIGWDDSKTHSGPIQGAWMIKNSWGTGWGASGPYPGCAWVAYGSANLGDWTSALCGYGNPPLAMFYHDEGGWMGWSYGSGTTATAWGAVRFTPSQDETLTAVDFWADDVSMGYEIKIFDTLNDLGSGNYSFSSQLGTTQTGTTVEGGYYSIPLSTPVSLTSGDDFIVQVKLTSGTSGWYYPIPIDYYDATSHPWLPSHSSVATFSGESYYSNDGAQFGKPTEDVGIRARAEDTTPPTMETINEPQGQYYNTAPSFSNFGFDDNVALDDGWYQMDSYAGTWEVLFTDDPDTSWDDDGWAIPDFGGLAEGSRTIYFKASDDTANVEGENGEWGWQFFKDTAAPAAPTNLDAPSYINIANEAAYTVTGDAEADSTVEVKITDGTITVTNTGTATGGAFSIAVDCSTLADGTDNIDIDAKATDAAGNASGYSTALTRSKDTAVPADPTGVSSDPAISTWSNDDTVTVTWTASVDAGSGLDGYSILWDTTDNTVPDASIDIQEGITSDTSAALADGDSHYFHIRAVDNAGNWVATVHVGPFFIDTEAPADPTGVSSDPATSTWSNDDTVTVTWTASVDAGSGLDGYSILWDTTDNTVPDASIDIQEGITSDTSAALADGDSHYFHIRAVDQLGNWQSTVHVGPFFIDTTPPGDPTGVTSPSHTLSTWSTDNTVTVTWTASVDAGSGLDGYSILWDTTDNTVPDASIDIQEGITSDTSAALADGDSHYFHIRAVDQLGNWQSTVHVGPFFIDTTPPAAVTDLAAGNPTRTSMELTWTAPGDDADTGTASTYDIRYSISLITEANWDSATQCTDEPTPSAAGSAETFTVTGLSNLTTYYFALKTADKVPNWSTLSNIASGTTQNSPPVLSNGAVSPTSGYTSTTFTYSVTYTDADNDPPASPMVSIDDGLPEDMGVKAEEDGDYTNGEIYEYTVTGADLGLGSHTFQFTASDGIDIATGDIEIHDGPTVRSRGGGGGGGGGRDTRAPVISNIECSDCTKTSIIIKWRTGERGTSQVESWASEHMFSPLDESLVTYHEVKLTNLKPCCVYHFRVISKDSSGNEAISEEETFTTLGTPATFAVSALSISPAEVEIGESITISVLVANTGDATGTYASTLKLENVVVAIESVTLAGGASEEVTFITSKDVAGTYTVSVDGQSGAVVVIKPPTPTPAPEVPQVTLPTPEAPINWWLIGGIIAAIVAVLLLTYFYVWRKRGVSKLT